MADQDTTLIVSGIIFDLSDYIFNFVFFSVSGMIIICVWKFCSGPKYCGGNLVYSYITLLLFFA